MLLKWITRLNGYHLSGPVKTHCKVLKNVQVDTLRKWILIMGSQCYPHKRIWRVQNWSWVEFSSFAVNRLYRCTDRALQAVLSWAVDGKMRIVGQCKSHTGRGRQKGIVQSAAVCTHLNKISKVNAAKPLILFHFILFRWAWDAVQCIHWVTMT